MFESSYLLFKKVYNSNARYYLIAYLAIFIYSFVKVPLLSSIYTPTQLGTYAYYGAILSYIDILFLSWVSSTAWRYVYDKKEVQSVSKLITTILPLLFLTSFISFICLFLFITFFKQHSSFTDILLTGYFTILTQQFISLYLLVLQSQNKIKKWCSLLTTQNVLSLILLLFLTLILKKGVVSIFFSSLLVNTCLLIWITMKYRGRIKLLVRDIDPNLYKKIFSYSVFIIVSGTCLLILNNADRFIIDFYKGKSNVGIYSQTYSLAYVGFYSIIQVFSTVFLPIYNKNFVHSRELDTNRNIIQLYIILFTPFLLFCVFHSNLITQLFLGKNFEGYDNIFRLILLSIYFFGLGNFFEIRLKFHKKIKIVTLVLIIIAFLNILLNIFLLKKYSIEVAALNTLISFALLASSFILLNHKFFLSINLRGIIINLFYATCLYRIFIYLGNNILQQLGIINQLTIYTLCCFMIYALFLNKEITSIKKTLVMLLTLT